MSERIFRFIDAVALVALGSLALAVLISAVGFVALLVRAVLGEHV